MDMFQQIMDKNLLGCLTKMLEDKIGSNNINCVKNDGCIFFFIGSSSILQIIPDSDAKFTYANSPLYQEEIREVIESFKRMISRDEKIEDIIKKESD